MADAKDLFIVCSTIDEVGGVQRWAHDISGLFASRGHRVTLIGVTPVAEPVDYLPPSTYRRIVLHDTIVPPTSSPRGLARLNVGTHLRRVREDARVDRAVSRLNELLRQRTGEGAIIVTQVWAMPWVARADTSGLPIIGMSHESFAASRRSPRYQRVKKRFSKVDRFVTLTAEDADAWARDGMGNADWIPNPLMITPTRLPTLDDKVVVTVGRLSHEKGMDMLVEAWAGIAPRFPEWRLHIYGSGPEEAAIRSLCERLGVAERLELRGRTDDVSGALASASVFAMPSRQEGFPLGLLESMAHGLPAVAFDCAPGVRELVDDGSTGLLAPPGNVPAFAAALESLMADKDRRSAIGAKAQQTVERFAPDHILDQWESMFALVCS